MTTIVSRLFADRETAEAADKALRLQNHPDANISLVDAGSEAEAEMIAARLPEETAKAYAAAMSGSQTAVIVRAPDTPFGAARNAIDTMNEFDALETGVENENMFIPDRVKDDLLIDLKVDRTHRYWASSGKDVRRGRISDSFGWRCVYSGKKFFGSFLTDPLHERKFWGSFLLDPLTHGHMLPGQKVFTGKKLFGSFLVDPISKYD